ncbi:MAG: DNA polymerase III subunit beta [Aphanocapsa sp. GSE-SYN-MK-11-07L]|jgi:DNA polymerase-3 subunit beta|nr:DNA polymerase III subunit beta [Aphanocapsa sp. GSE-SYN-MK-11-07L]
MKLVCAQNDLSARLSLLSRVVPSNPSHPVLANVLLIAEPDRLGLAVFDLSLGMQVWIPAQTEVPGSITLPARFFNDIVSRLPNAPIEIAVDEVTTTLTCGSGHYQMQGISAEEFPALPELEDSQQVVLSAALLLEGLQGSVFAVSSDESKQVLTGLHLSTQSKMLEFAATDGHRLAIANSAIETPDIAVTVPAKALRELEKLLGRQETDLTLRFDPGQVVFEFATEQGMARLSSRLLEGQYPNYNQLIPKQFERQITIERQLLVSGLERVAVLAAQKNNVIKLSINAAKQQIDLSAEAPQFGSGEESISAQVSGDDLDVAFNVKYLIDGLKAMNSSEVQIQLNSATSPAIVRPLTGTKITYLIMPIQIRS